MNLQEQYKKETGKDAFQNCETDTGCPTESYVEWLENRVEKTRDGLLNQCDRTPFKCEKHKCPYFSVCKGAE